ncbi:alpha/beta hydrolase [Flexithrix dorotheae]|uniref:alpha/beta hydrolase n=1 Tax=Flexithrix dorotheae TaxID=70993 RepID=UPI0004771277|nr:alpha/beta fold hydrolase [Flexithrix dorotheae]
MIFGIIISLISVYILVCFVYFLIQDRIIFLPEKLAPDFKYTFNFPFEELHLESNEGAVINVLHAKTNQPKGVILYFHGNAGSLERWGELIEDFLPFGYDVFMPDYRTYGKSTGKLTEENLHLDAKMCYEYLSQKYDNIIIYGRSLGSGLACKLASEVKSKLVVLETPYYNIHDVAQYYTPFLPSKLLLKFRFRNDIYLEKISVPVYIFHGTSDKIIPYTSAVKLSHKLRENGEFVTIPGGKHNNLAEFEQFNRKLQEILN